MFPPLEGKKKEVLTLRSKRSIVMAPAKTGKLKTNKKAVTTTAQANNLSWLTSKAAFRKLEVVAIKLIPPKIDEAPAT